MNSLLGRHERARDVHDMIGVGVVGALDAEDREAFERHLAACAACRDELVALEDAASQLSFLAAAPPPPAALRTAVLQTIETTSQLPEPPSAGMAALAVSRDDTSSARHLEARPTHRRARVLTLLVAAVSLGCLALGGLVYSMTTPPQPTASRPAPEASVLSAPDARVIPTTLSDGTHVSFVISRSQDHAVFVAAHLPSPQPGSTYQVWMMHDRTAVPDRTIDGRGDVSELLSGSLDGTTALAVTTEPAGGSRVPTLPIMVRTSI